MEGRIEVVSGQGLLDARAMFASIVGPNRLAMAPRTTVTLKLSEGTLIAKNLGAADAYVLVGVGLPSNAAVNPLTTIFSKDPEMGFNNGLPVRLTDHVSTDFSILQLLLPGEALYAQITNAAVATQNVVVSTVQF